ncbi:MAG: MoxR family ATPase [Verrucomicrobiota bacterium]|nr:MoxR family ATPase [Verrucomicrobiota bacterium]MDI9382803.1 MoxR family ATPase [Verrucomicrobiota bacterium]
MDGRETLNRITDNLHRVIKGKTHATELIVTALCAGGHVLIEDVPGVGKTTLCKALAKSISGDFHRIQFTPDLLPTDIVGGMVYSPKDGGFSFRPGPVFCHILLADEINRASPRTQSALLECMSEGQVSIEGRTYPMSDPFMVIATQNPVEYHGTYPLPEAQLDRFALRIDMGYPSAEEEMELVQEQRQHHPLLDLTAVASVDEVRAAALQAREVVVEQSVIQYATELVRKTRTDSRIKLGASPRATATLYRCGQAYAFIQGRDYVMPDDIKRLAIPVLAHRIIVETKAAFSGDSKQGLVQELLESQPVPA